jgi:mono/diheme cytochrome c family protein
MFAETGNHDEDPLESCSGNLFRRGSDSAWGVRARMIRFGRRWLWVLVFLVLALVGFRQFISAQAESSTVVGVYTAEQAQLGKSIYEKECASCHGESLEGKGKNAPLSGDAFLGKWNDQSMADLFMKTNTTMPASSPGTLTPDETVRLLAYVLQMNKFPAGKSELPTDPDALGAIKIGKP